MTIQNVVNMNLADTTEHTSISEFIALVSHLIVIV